MILLSNNTTISGLASGLQKVRWAGDFKFTACCPAHYDKHPSLSVTETNGKILLKCFAGCSQESVIGALRELGLWHNASRHQLERRKRADLKEETCHHQRMILLGAASTVELSEADIAQMRESMGFLKEHTHG